MTCTEYKIKTPKKFREKYYRVMLGDGREMDEEIIL